MSTSLKSSPVMARDAFTTAVITATISKAKVAELEKVFSKVYNIGDGLNPDLVIPDHILREADVWYTNWIGIPGVTSLDQVPNTKAVQLSSAGANKFLDSRLMASEEARKRIKVCNASGIHVVSIPQYIVANVINVYMSMPMQILAARQEARWDGYNMPHHRSLIGKTVGLLGYGHIAREAARLFKAFNCEIIAANSTGKRGADIGYVVPGTGDMQGSIPSEMYSTSDESSFNEFLSRSEILVASLPSTPNTEWLLTKERLARLPVDAVFVNVGRGDLVKSSDLLEALDREDGLSGAVLDVTDPEPLPQGHPLFTHPKVIVTPHTSSHIAKYFDLGADLLIKQAEQIRQGKPLLNVVDPEKGY
ncbi:D-isomer specific 2-hydroxyacid dehydrogenase [Naematelia encephala]|uniref:D-isomer specific 2-hydroxyacid dehydrogenase n=1 Tax=Naematelia encephala TaxID=71784 RepID=A0A1Y2AEX6_9TREE|nr:D-isomer specific 2-hydroxyacid dehydrogenase [Naematelia encephala]